MNGSQHLSAALGPEHVTQTEELLLRFRTNRAGLLLRTAALHSGDRIELAVAAGRIRASIRLGDREKVKYSTEICVDLQEEAPCTD